jgi:F-type H+-transporting ATPase subunit delta
VRSQHAARSYARALFELAKERGQTQTVVRELASLVELVEGDAQLREFLAQPGVGASAKRAVARELADRLRVSPLVRDFVALVADHGRGAQIPDIAEALGALVDADAGRVRARVRSAVALSDDERTALASRLGAAVGKTVVIDDRVDAGLLGGFVAEVGGLVADGSLDGQLARMKERLERG